MARLKVLVAGGGIGGVTAALCLAKLGHEISVFEQAPGVCEVGAGIQLSPNCTRVLHYLGLEEALRAIAFLPQGTQFRNWRTGRVIAESTLGDEAVKRYGFPYYHIHRADLLRVLVEAAQRMSNITLHRNSRVHDIAQDGSGVRLSAADAVWQGDVLVGADGIQSAVRAMLWGDDEPRFTGNVAWRAMVPADKLPKGLIRPMSTAWWGPGKHFVHYYVRRGVRRGVRREVRRGEFVNCVCVVEKDGWEVESWTEPGDHGELKDDFAGWHDDIQTLIDNAETQSLFKWALFDRPPMDPWGKDRVTLLGDACHPTLPFMAQGAAMAIEDAAVLAGCLANDDGVPTGLQRYEDLRRERTSRVQKGSRRNATVFHLSGIKAWVRDRAARSAGDRTMDSLFTYNALEAANS